MSFEIITTIIAIIIFLLLSAFFSGSETSLTGASKIRMHQLTKEGNKRANIVNKLISNRERLIGAILLGNNLVNILATSLATSICIMLFNDKGVAYAVLIMTVLILIFSEILPKTYAIANTDKSALGVAKILLPIVYILAPITSFIQFIVRKILLLFGIDISEQTRVLSPQDEIRGAISLYHKEGRFIKDEKDMLGSILDLPEVQVSEIMIHRKNIFMLNIDELSISSINKIQNSPYTRIPIWETQQENIIGFLHIKDILKSVIINTKLKKDIDFRNLLLKPWFIPETTTLKEQLKTFLEKRRKLAFVVDEYGVLMGLITLKDIIEEITGDITDEHDIKFQDVKKGNDNSYIVKGTVSIRELNRELEWNLPDEEAPTIAGLVINESQSLPEVGQKFSFYNYKFEILKKYKNQITLIKIFPPS